MKRFDNAENDMEDLDFDQLNEEMNILFGNVLGAVSITETHLITNCPHYNEVFPWPMLKENEAAVKNVNDYVRLYTSRKPDKLPQ